MDTIAPTLRRETLHKQVEEAKTALNEAADAAVIRNDPLCQHLNALALSVGAHYEIFCAAEDTQLALAQSLRTHTEAVTKGVLDLVRTSANAMTKELGPQLIKAVLPTVQLALQFMKQRTIYFALFAMLIALLISNMFTYAAGLNAGRAQGEAAAHAIQTAMAAGPDAALDWASLMANNDPGPELVECRKMISKDEYGRKSCAMPVWLDPAQSGHP